jgi:bacteriocin-like protein
MMLENLFKFNELTSEELSHVKGGTLSKNIKEIRIEQHMTQEVLAQKLFVSKQAISQWERGVREPTIDILIQMKKIFHVSFDRLLE